MQAVFRAKDFSTQLRWTTGSSRMSLGIAISHARCARSIRIRLQTARHLLGRKVVV